MAVFEITIALLLGGAILAAIARRIALPYPALVAVAGAALALIPGVPTLVLDPALALALFVAPVLLDAAFDSSPRDLRANWRVVASLAVGAVILTIAAVAFVAHSLVPTMSWAAAIVLGAIVAPSDAVAATAVLRQLRPPHRLLVILEGESLFNDATALLVYRIAVGAAFSGFVAGWTLIPMVAGITLGSIVLGLVLARIVAMALTRVYDVATAVICQFCTAFAVWLLAERLHLSGILTMVVFAMAISRLAGETQPARLRIPSYAVWEVAVFVLNVLAFILVGFQLRLIVRDLESDVWRDYAVVAAAVTGAVILARIVWVVGAAAFSRWRCRPRANGTPGPHDAIALNPKAAAVVGWCGMRGTVTLAAALALPANFPQRDLILFTSFAVVLGTLVVQGVTLRPLLAWLRLEDDGSVEREVRLARVETLRAALDAIETCPGAETAELVRQRYELMLRRAEAGEAVEESAQELAADAEVVRVATAAERQRLSALRADGTIGDAAYQRVEQELDWEELDLEQLMRA